MISSVHDGDIAPVLTALNIFSDPKYGAHLPVTHIAEDRTWRTSMVMPMGGRITFERLQCNDDTSKNSSSQGTFVRININDDVLQLPDCHDSPGDSCPIDQFVERVRKRRAQVSGFVDVCGQTMRQIRVLPF
jgi:acid phosphatase